VAGGFGDCSNVAQQLVALSGDSVEGSGQLVDDLRVVLGQIVVFGVVGPQPGVVLLKVLDSGLELDDRWRITAGRTDSGLELPDRGACG